MPSATAGGSYSPSSSSQKHFRCDYGRSQSVKEGQGSVSVSQTDKLCHSEADNTVSPLKRAETATRSLSGPIQSQPEGIEKCIAAQRVPHPCRSVEKLHEFLTDCEKIPGPSQHLQVTQLMESIDGKEKHDAFNSRTEEKQPSTTQASAKNIPSSQQQQFQCEKEATSPEKGKRQRTSHKPLQPGLQNPKDSEGCHGKCISDGQNNGGIAEKGGRQIKISEMIAEILDRIKKIYIAMNDVKSHISDKNSSICNNLNTHNSSLSKINETLMCLENVLRTIKASKNDSSFGNKLNEQAINIIKEDNKKVLDDIANSFAEVKTYTICVKSVLRPQNRKYQD
ncbi:hypothetical protein O181_005176 [Austropuccinia psidii MF-1]|uniref:Uncharacterized protein n=1 Tax=Austropuccinia psidii MF-1 TaxID=1389203 RepID=A0A9Q3GFN9_9BASI|nr:hypothetical protein [Austropuccinia psidii MF-1]